MLNIVALTGRLTANPELKHTPADVAVCSFTLAVERTRCKPGEERQTDFINVVAWRGAAEFVCRYFTKGQMMAVTGSIQTRHYEDKQGSKRTAVEVIAQEISFCEKKAESGTNITAATVVKGNPEKALEKAEQETIEKAASEISAYLDDDSDLPF